jgi:pectin methylesterase-like acyl-CoA thioesterase
VNMRLSRVCGLATRQRVLLTLHGFVELTENKKVKLFKNTIQAYVQYLKELKQKGKKVAMKVISHSWRRYMFKLVKIWGDQNTLFHTYKDLTKEDYARFVKKCESEHFGSNSQYM